MICLTANPDAQKISRVRILDLLFLLVLLSNCLLALFGYCTSRQDHLSVWLSTDSKASFRGIVDACPMLFQCVKLISTFYFIFRCGYRISIRGYVRPSVRRSVGPSVRRSVGRSVRNAFVKIAKSIGKSSFCACMLHVHPFIGLSANNSVCQSIILSIYLSIRPSTHL